MNVLHLSGPASLTLCCLLGTSLAETNLERPERWLDTYLIAPRDAIELSPEEPYSELEFVVSVLGEPRRFRRIRVVERRGSRVLFKIDDGITVGWVEDKFVIPSSAFKEITNWTGPYHFRVCLEYHGCNSVYVESTGEFRWEHLPLIEDDCDFIPEPQGQWKDWEDWANNGWEDDPVCSTDGRVEEYKNYLRFRSRWDKYEEMVFQVGHDGRLCWIKPLELYDICMPLEAIYVETRRSQ